MAGDRGTSFPVAGLAVVTLFLSTLFLGPRGFDFLRQSENDAAKQVQLPQPSVEARLWEDPLEALRRHRDKLPELCKASGSADPSCRDGQPGTVEQFRQKFAQDRLTVIAAILPGATFVGSEESRRRSRYALLTGLDTAGYVPDNSERMSLLRVSRCTSFTTCKVKNDKNGDSDTKVFVASTETVAPPTPPPSATDSTSVRMDIVYETLSAAPGDTSELAARRRRVVVLWIDDSQLGRNWLSTLAVLLRKLTVDHGDARLRILGPATSDGLVMALEDLTALKEDLTVLKEHLTALKKDPAAPRKDAEALGSAADKADTFRKNWNVLARLRLISPNSTASDGQLVAAVRHPTEGQRARDTADAKPATCSPTAQPMEEVFKQRLDDIRNVLGGIKDWANEQKVLNPRMFFFRTIGTDDRLIDRLVDELFGRGLDERAAGASRRVALIGEWDSIYARTFAEALQTKLICRGEEKGLKIDFRSYVLARLGWGHGSGRPGGQSAWR